MINDRTVIGQGAYGCVHKPSLRCLDTNVNYDDYISKLTTKKQADKELSDFGLIQNIDPNNNYHLGTPLSCTPNTIFNKEKEDIKKCKYLNKYDIFANPNNYKLLLMKYGGSDLKQFCANELNDYLTENAVYKIDMFWLNAYNLLKGLHLFQTNKISHCDIKPANIVFDKNEYEFKFIDFGLMSSFDSIKMQSFDNNNELSVFHWSYPLETGFMNADNYNKYLSLTNADRNTFAEQFIHSITTGEDYLTGFDPIGIENPGNFKLLFSNILSTKEQSYLHNFLNGFNKMINFNTYEQALYKIIQSIDVYSLGITLQYTINMFMKTNMLSNEYYSELTNVFSKMYNFDITNRLLDTDIILDEYENALIKLNILSRLNKQIINRTIIDKQFAGYKRRITKYVRKHRKRCSKQSRRTRKRTKQSKCVNKRF